MKKIFTVVIFDEQLNMIVREDCGTRRKFADQFWDDAVYFHDQHPEWVVLEMYKGTGEDPFQESVNLKRLK